jgi:hypothetical protein
VDPLNPFDPLSPLHPAVFGDAAPGRPPAGRTELAWVLAAGGVAVALVCGALILVAA